VTSLNKTGQQWDAPNGWSPLQWMTIVALRNYGHIDLANTIKHRWLDMTTKVYQQTGKMMEKYNVMDTTLLAGGGEYENQDGFGWTNGVILQLLKEI
jgi:alpha,alpha-trehalase